MLKSFGATLAGAALLLLIGPAAADNAPGTSAVPSPGNFGGGYVTAPTLMVRPSAAEAAAQLLARQDSRADSLRQSVLQLRAQFENDLAALRTRMRSELVDGTFLPMYGATTSQPSPPAGACSSGGGDPCPDCDKLRASDFDRWFAQVMRLYDVAKSWQDADFTRWADERAKKRQEVAAKKLTQLEDGAEWQEREATFYGEVFGFTLSQGILVWDVTAAEVVGLGAVSMPTLKGIMEANGKFTRGPADYGGLLARFDADAAIALRTTHRKVSSAWCEAENAFTALVNTPTDPPETRNAAEAKVVGLDQRYEDEILACRKEEDAQRDAYAAKLRPIRQRLHDDWQRMSARLGSWRESLIAAHIYAGEGEESIEAQYGNGQATTLADGLVAAFLPLKQFTRDRIADNSLYRGPTTNLTNVTGGVPAKCWSDTEHLVASFIKHDDTRPSIKYADLEVGPFSFGLGDYKVDGGRSSNARSAVALGGRMPEDGP
jgi:hypothetical protein